MEALIAVRGLLMAPIGWYICLYATAALLLAISLAARPAQTAGRARGDGRKFSQTALEIVP
jgi:hypothetical protein